MKFPNFTKRTRVAIPTAFVLMLLATVSGVAFRQVLSGLNKRFQKQRALKECFIGERAAANVLRFPPAPPGRRTQGIYLNRNPLSPEIDSEWFGYDRETGCPFRAGDDVKASTFGELAVFEKALRTTVIRPLDANQVVVKIDDRECWCPTSWFAVDIMQPVRTEPLPPKVVQPDYAVGDVVQFQSSGLGLPFYPMARSWLSCRRTKIP
jgi:hypothetical protein